MFWVSKNITFTFFIVKVESIKVQIVSMSRNQIRLLSVEILQYWTISFRLITIFEHSLIRLLKVRLIHFFGM